MHFPIWEAGQRLGTALLTSWLSSFPGMFSLLLGEGLDESVVAECAQQLFLGHKNRTRNPCPQF